MNKSRFIELLNLYVDQEISVDQAEQLEAEISRNPARRRTYNQYCRLQRACVQLFEDENAHAPVPSLSRLLEASKSVDEKIEAFVPPPIIVESQRSLRSGWWPRLAAGGALAACLALVAVGPVRQIASRTNGADDFQSGASKVAQTSVAPALESSVATSSPVSELVQLATLERRAPAEDTRSALYLRAWLRSAELAESRRAEYAAAPIDLDWTRNVQFTPIEAVSPEQLRFESRESFSTPAVENRTFRGRGASAANVELSAFQFQR